MIVVDTNVIAYLWLHGPYTADAARVHHNDPDWVAPVLWRSEFRNILATHMRLKLLDLGAANHVMAEAESLMDGRERIVKSVTVLSLAASSSCSAYDCE